MHELDAGVKDAGAAEILEAEHRLSLATNFGFFVTFGEPRLVLWLAA
jgi:hypothetical protein